VWQGFGVGAIALVCATTAMRAEWVHPLAMPQTAIEAGVLLAVIEIPAGSITKYEIDPRTGHLVVDRFQSMPVRYPANYGAIPSSLAGDGDPLDVLVITRDPVAPGAFIHVRPIGVLRMTDAGEADAKIIAVPIHSVDPTFDTLGTITDLPAIERERIEAFFRVYKDLPAERKAVELGGYAGAAEAWQVVRSSIAAYGR
jgi:inorganic pyrophosphatase